MAFAERLREFRTKAGLSQERLSLALGISKRTVINYESGETLPSSEKLPAIAKYLGVSVESLISEDEEFVALAYEQGGSRGAKEAEALINGAQGLFAGGRLSEEEKDTVMRAIQNAYWIAKEENKRKFAPKKSRGRKEL